MMVGVKRPHEKSTTSTPSEPDMHMTIGESHRLCSAKSDHWRLVPLIDRSRQDSLSRGCSPSAVRRGVVRSKSGAFSVNE